MRLATPDPWARLLDESAEEYVAFTDWLQDTQRGIPERQDVATKHDWSGRARAFEVQQSLATNPREQLKVAIGMMISGAAIEAGKMLREISCSEGRTMTQRELISTFALVTELKNAGWLESEDIEDLSDLSDDELADLARVSSMMKRKRA